MNNLTKLPITFWIISVIALLWNLMGVGAFVSDMMMTPEAMAEMTPELRNYYENNPLWNKIAFGAAVIFGVLGSIGLLMKKSWALPMFSISLMGVLINNIYTWMFSGTAASATGAQMGMSAGVTLIALFLWFYAKKGIGKGWLS